MNYHKQIKMLIQTFDELIWLIPEYVINNVNTWVCYNLDLKRNKIMCVDDIMLYALCYIA